MDLPARKHAWLLGLLGGCVGSQAFICDSDEACTNAGAAGICQTDGFCSFPDSECASGQRYSGQAGELSGQCVPEGGASATSTDSGSAGTTGVSTSTSAGDSSDGTGDGGPIEFTDDEFGGEFGAGQFFDVEWAGGRVRLVPGVASGRFESRVFDAGTEQANWQQLSWGPVAPYAKPLPDGGAAEVGYVDGVDMSDNILLLHLDAAGAAGPGATLPDSSGAGHDAIVAADTLGADLGRFGGAVADSDTSYYYVDLGTTDDFDFGTGDFTWSLWVNTTSECIGVPVSNNQVYMGVEDVGVDRAHLWFGCVRPSSPNCPLGGASGGRPGGTFRAVHNVDGGGFCGTATITDGLWHHMVVTKTGHPVAVIQMYVDGAVDYSGNTNFSAPIVFNDSPQFAMGAFSEGTFQARGLFDEMAVWRRALTPEEVAAVYLRGALQLGLQARVCPTPDCDGVAFTGPGGDAGLAFVAPADGLDATPVIDLGPLIGRYFQYHLLMGSSAADTNGFASPELKSVTARGIR